MLKSLHRADKAILSWCQRRADWLTDWFGLTCFQVSRFLLCVYLALDGVLCYQAILREGGVPWSGVIAGAAIFLYWLPSLRRVEQMCRGPHKNPFEHEWRFLRVILVAVSLNFIGLVVLNEVGIFPYNVQGLQPGWTIDDERRFDFAIIARDLVVNAAIYFAACTPRPPRSIFDVELARGTA